MFLHFSGNGKESGKTNENYDRLWKIRNVCDKLNAKETQMLWIQKLETVLFGGLCT
jgi:hypothetical protein